MVGDEDRVVIKYECLEWEKDANYVECDDSEVMVLTVQGEESNLPKKCTWFLGLGCSNHMTRDRRWFYSLDDTYRNHVRLGNDVRMAVMGKGHCGSGLGEGSDDINKGRFLLSLSSKEGLNYKVTNDNKYDVRVQGQSKFSEGLPFIKDEAKPCADCIKMLELFLDRKSQALETFKKFKVLVEKEAEVKIKCLRTDRGGEFNSEKAWPWNQGSVAAKSDLNWVDDNHESDDLSEPGNIGSNGSNDANVSGEGLSNDDDSGENVAMFSSTSNLENYEEASQEECWRLAMEQEIKSIDKNHTWELCGLPDTIRTILAFAAQQGQPQGFEIQRMEEKVYRLRKALYGVKRAPRAWSDKEEELFIVLVYVGDLIITGTTLSLIEKFKTSIKSEFEMFNMEDCNGVKNPIAPGFKLVKDDHSGHVNATLYMEAPIEQHMAALKRVLRYIHETSSFGVCYKKRGRDQLVAFSDNDYAGDYDNRRSTPGYVCFLSRAVVACVRLSRRPVEAAQGFNFSVVTTLVSISAGFFAPRIFFKDNVP
ncbi:putative RNA-directed DNA polymerase, partial [Tanacetum coccineum]